MAAEWQDFPMKQVLKCDYIAMKTIVIRGISSLAGIISNATETHAVPWPLLRSGDA